MKFPHKGYGRIYVEKEEDIQKVKDIIKEMDEIVKSIKPIDVTLDSPKPWNTAS